MLTIIQQLILDRIAKLIIDGQVKEGEGVTIEESKGEIIIKEAEKAEVIKTS